MSMCVYARVYKSLIMLNMHFWTADMITSLADTFNTSSLAQEPWSFDIILI